MVGKLTNAVYRPQRYVLIFTLEFATKYFHKKGFDRTSIYLAIIVFVWSRGPHWRCQDYIFMYVGVG